MSTQFTIQKPGSILFAHDGSKAADQAAPIVRELARRGGLAVTLLHVFDSVRELSEAAVGVLEWSQHAFPRAIIEPPAVISDAVSVLSDGAVLLTIIGRLGDPTDEIVWELERMTDPWIVMSSLGATGIRRLLIGSTAFSTIQRTTAPVLVVPATSTRMELDWPGHSPVVTLVDGTKQSEASVGYGCGIAETLGLEHVLVRVAETLGVAADDTTHDRDSRRWAAEIERKCQNYLTNVAETCKTTGAKVQTELLRGEPSKTIVNYVAETKPAMLVVATRRRSGIERWTYGSFTKPLVGALPTPTLFIPVESD